ncbi:DUF1295 domain-containing protein [Maritalea mediterranea]|uniref:DUF1295 domain-containing protein n=1 Tax=Maritalea mediterranea TaxID=2909667 RepID=A0ABS9E2E8_9HYPH|nr:DUF1295 domain-containing protein [Maritalea mediterranea]MCF4097041.1 DUF1295 domain-containing protein [Maritalea mediterranea]
MLELYGSKSKSIPQKITITLIELALIGLSAWIMFGEGAPLLAGLFGWTLPAETPVRYSVILAFNLIILLRMGFMMFYLMQRTLPWSEAFTVPSAFAIYYVGFAILVLPNDAPLGRWDYLGIALFALGCVLNTLSELQRHWFKKDPANKGKLYTGGLFAYSMHINFFGDIVWVIGYALVAGHWLGAAIPVMLFGLFAFYNVPMLDDYLRDRYGEQFKAYEARTKRLVPFIF